MENINKNVQEYFEYFTLFILLSVFAVVLHIYRNDMISLTAQHDKSRTKILDQIVSLSSREFSRDFFVNRSFPDGQQIKKRNLEK